MQCNTSCCIIWILFDFQFNAAMGLNGSCHRNSGAARPELLHQMNSWQFSWCSILHHVTSIKIRAVFMMSVMFFAPMVYYFRPREMGGVLRWVHQNRASPFASDFYRRRGYRRELRIEDHFYPFSSQKNSLFASDFPRRGNHAAWGLKKSRFLGSGKNRRGSRRESRGFGALRYCDAFHKYRGQGSTLLSLKTLSALIKEINAFLLN